MPQKAEPDSWHSHSSLLLHDCIYEVSSKATPLINRIPMTFVISATLGLILDLEKSSLIISFWHQDELFTCGWTSAQHLCWFCWENDDSSSADFSCRKTKGSISKVSSNALRFFSIIDFNVITLFCLTSLYGSGRINHHILGTWRYDFVHHLDEIRSEHL